MQADLALGMNNATGRTRKPPQADAPRRATGWAATTPSQAQPVAVPLRRRSLRGAPGAAIASAEAWARRVAVPDRRFKDWNLQCFRVFSHARSARHQPQLRASEAACRCNTFKSTWRKSDFLELGRRARYAGSSPTTFCRAPKSGRHAIQV